MITSIVDPAAIMINSIDGASFIMITCFFY